MTRKSDAAPKPAEPREAPHRAAYEPPRLTAYGSLAKLTRSGTGTVMEAGMGPNLRFA